MSRLRLLFLRMDDHRRLLLYMGINKEGYTQDDERNAEKLSHIQDHVLLESYLRLLDELDEEAHAETPDEEGSDEEATIELVESVLVHQDLEHAKKEVAESLIKLSRMLRLGLSTEFEDEAPRQRSHIAVYL